MKHESRVQIYAIALSVALAQSQAVMADEEEQGGSHQHYADSPAAQNPGPAGELAPRLQNLGKHVFRSVRNLPTRNASSTRG